MELSASNFFALDPLRKREVHLFLCGFALERWETYIRSHSPLVYQDSIVGMTHTVDERLPRDAFESGKTGRDKNNVAKRYREPIVAMQHDDLEFPQNIEHAYYAVHNFFCKYAQRKDVDDWLIVNQSLASFEDLPDWKQIFSDIVRRAMR